MNDNNQNIFTDNYLTCYCKFHFMYQNCKKSLHSSKTQIFKQNSFPLYIWKNLFPFFRIVISYAAINCHFISEIKENSKLFSSKISKVFFFLFLISMIIICLMQHNHIDNNNHIIIMLIAITIA